MSDSNNKGFYLLLLLKNPTVLLVLVIVIILGSIMSTIFLISNNDSGMSQEDLELYYTSCTEGELNQEEFNSMFDDAGAFTGLESTFISVSRQNSLDPVLLASIAFHETGYGTSSALRNKNNPGGLMNPSTGSLFVFDSVAEGLASMASNLRRLYIEQGLVTIPLIGAKYAPTGAANDPNNLNIHWVPNVSALANDFGGLTMNCEVVNTGSGEFMKPIPNAPITSPFGYRIHPITGEHKLHKGIDFDCNTGDPIYAAQSGRVVEAVKGCVAGNSSCGGGYGNRVLIDHGDKYTLYAHLVRNSLNPGQSISQGQLVGQCGTTGSSTGSHLHFEVQITMFGERVDPMGFLGGGE